MSSGRTRWAVLSGIAAASAAAMALLFARRRAPVGVAAPATPAKSASADRAVALLPRVSEGERGTGGYYGTWAKGSSDAAVARHIEFQYAGMGHQSQTALSGMWLFLATELLFFGGLFFLYLNYRAQYPQAFAVASQHTEVVIGTANTLILLTSSAVFAWGLGHARDGNNHRLFQACCIVITLGIAFLGLKGWEWSDDLHKHLFPGPGFAITGQVNGGAQLFWMFYWVGTVLHGVHMVVGVGLVGWLAQTARKGRYSRDYCTPPEVVGLYWSFVDMVWLCLYPMIYLVGQGP